MIYKLMRFTPTKSLTYNNRWYQPVKPKHNLFFIPPDIDQFFIWLDFLCTTHRKSYLYIHVLELQAVRKRTRTLTIWKDLPVREVMIRDRNYIKRLWFHTQRIPKNMTRVPQVLKRYLK